VTVDVFDNKEDQMPSRTTEVEGNDETEVMEEIAKAMAPGEQRADVTDVQETSGSDLLGTGPLGSGPLGS
jgi:hypothetical protein